MSVDQTNQAPNASQAVNYSTQAINVLNAYEALAEKDKQLVDIRIKPPSVHHHYLMEPSANRERAYIIYAFILVLFIGVIGLVISSIFAKEFDQYILTVITTILGYLAGVITVRRTSQNEAISPKKKNGRN